MFTLMPLEAKYRKSVEAQWSFVVTDMARRTVAFRDESVGAVAKWHWDFGDGTTSGEQHPVHRYQEAGKYLVVLNVEGPRGSARMAKLWDVAVE